MIKTALFAATLSSTSIRDRTCSVLWLIPESDQDLDVALGRILDDLDLRCWLAVGAWERSSHMTPDCKSWLNARRSAELRREATSVCAVAGEDWARFMPSPWRAFSEGRRHQVCGLLLSADQQVDPKVEWSALELVLAGGSRQMRPGVTHEQVLEALEQALLAEAVSRDTIVVVRAELELLRPGVTLVGSRGAIGQALRAAGGEALDAQTIGRVSSFEGWGFGGSPSV